MPTTDRRHSPRVKLNQLAYLNIEPDNGGIVLNVSEEGLCFRSMGPIQPDGPLRFSLQELNRKIDICGELVWTDDNSRGGGVRFNTLTKEARDRISDLSHQSDLAAEARSTLGAALLKALPSTESRRIARSLKPAVAWWKAGRRVKISGFTRGLAAGFLVSLAAFSVLVFSYQHRSDIGESLIHLGNRLSGKQVADSAPRPSPQQALAVIAPPSAPAIIPDESKSSAKMTSHNASAHLDVDPPEVTARPLKAPQRTRTPSTPAVSAPSVARDRSPAREGPAPEAEPPVLPIKEPASAAVPVSAATERTASVAKPNPLVTSMYSEVAPSLAYSPISSKVQMFFDLGRFKRESMAQNLHGTLVELGIESTVVSKRRLWGNSYQVLAGPYDDGDAERQIYTSLLSHGYKPRPFERGTRDFAFHSKLSIDGSPLPTGNFTVAWESYIADAKVKFTQGNGLLAAADGKWVKHPAKFARNEYVYQVQPDGSRPLLELHFAGMDRALVFRKGQP